jgi:integrase
MRVQKLRDDSGLRFLLLDGEGVEVTAVSDFLRHLRARGSSPNTLSAYAYDLLHFFRFLAGASITYREFSPRRALDLLEYLRDVSARGRARKSGAEVSGGDEAQFARLSPVTVNRILAAVSSFYEHLILTGNTSQDENPLRKVPDLAASRVTPRYVPFLHLTSRQRPVRRAVRVRAPQRLPRPLTDEQVMALFGSFTRLRDRAIFLLMLQGGLRPGEALGLHLEDVQYGRRRVVVRCRFDHPKGVRTKSRVERVVDLHEPEALAAVSAYVMRERPSDASTPHLFLVGGHRAGRLEPLGYSALAKLFRRYCRKASLEEPWVTPHALRHTHATRMWEGGMRELTLQKRLGHASPESTRLYTRVSDSAMLEDYHRALRKNSGEEGEE